MLHLTAHCQTIWADLFAFLAEQSAKHSPRGRNAASGRWTQAVRAGLGRHGRVASSSAYEVFHGGLAQAFRRYLVTAGRWNQATPRLNLGDLHVGASAIAHGLVAESRLEELVRDIERRTDELNGPRRVVWNGKRANGHLSWRIAEAARAARYLLGRGSESFVLGKALSYVEALPMHGHTPWLRADWQLRFELICRVAAAALSASAPNPRAP